MYYGDVSACHPTEVQTEAIYPTGIDKAPHRQIYDAARELASGEYSQGWAAECALGASDWLRTYAAEALTPSAWERLDPSTLKEHVVATAPYGANRVYESAMGSKLSPNVRLDGVSFRSVDGSFYLIVVDDQSDRWKSLDQREQQFWVNQAGVHQPADVAPALLLNTAIVLARDEQLRRAVNEEVIHAVQDQSLPDPVKEVLVRYLEYQMPLGNVHPPQEVISCYELVDQLAARYGTQAILKLNFGTLDDATLRSALIDHIWAAAPALFSPVIHETYSISNR